MAGGPMLSFPDDEAPAQEEGLTLDTGDGRRPLPADKAQVKAQKVDVALGDKSPGVDTILSSIATGNEDSLRRSMSQAADMRAFEDKNRVIMDLMKKKQAEGQPVTDREVEFVRQMATGEFEEFRNDPETFFESAYAKKYTEQWAKEQLEAPDPLREAEDTVTTEEVDALKEIGKNIVARKEAAQDIYEQLEEKWSETGVAGKAWEWGKQIIPFYSWLERRNAVGGAPTSSFLPGNNAQDQYDFLQTLSPEEFRKALSQAVEDMDPLEAMYFVQGAIHHSVDDANLDNFFGFVDVADSALIVGSIAASGARIIRRGSRVAEGSTEAITRARNALRGHIRANGTRSPDPVAVAEASGRLDRAALTEVARRLEARVLGEDPLGDSRSLIRSVPSLFRPTVLTTDLGTLSATRAARLMDNMLESGEHFINAILNPGKPNRLGKEALARAMQEAESRLIERYPIIERNILNVSRNMPENSFANVGSVNIDIGDVGAKLFDSATDAVAVGTHVYRLEPSSFRVVPNPEGSGHMIRLTKEINETEDAVRDLLIEPSRRSKDTLANTFLGWLRTSDDIVSADQRANRKIVTTASNELRHEILQAAKPLLDLTKNHREARALEKVLKANRDTLYEELNAKGEKTGRMLRGEFYQNIGQFERGFQGINGRLPTDRETAAYFNYVQLMEWDYMVRNIGMYRDYVRQGAEQITMKAKEMGPLAVVNGGSEVKFTGVVHKDLPWTTKEDFAVYVMEEDGTGNLLRRNRLTGEQKDDITQKLDEGGYRVVQIFNPMDKPLKDLVHAEDTVHFVVVKDFSAGRLEMKILPNRPGGHVEYVHPHFVAQPKVRRTEGYRSEPKAVTGTGLNVTATPQRKLVNDPGPKPAPPKEPKREFVPGTSVPVDEIQEEIKDLRKRIAGYDPNDYADLKHRSRDQATLDKLGWYLKKNGTKQSPAREAYVKAKAEYDEKLRKWQEAKDNPQYEEIKATTPQTNAPVTAQPSGNTRHIYEGKTAILNVPTEAEGVKLAQAMEKARILLKTGNLREFSKHVRATLPFRPKQLKQMFEPYKDGAGKMQPPKLHIDDPIYYVPHGREITDIDKTFAKRYPNFEDDIRNPYNLFANVDKKFGGQRDPNLPSYKEGTETNPILSLAEPQLVDPYVSINKALGNIMRSRFFNDYKIAAVEDWIEEFKDVLGNSQVTIDDLRRDPVWFFHNPPYDTTTANRNRIRVAEHTRKSALNFIGTHSDLGKDIGWVENKIANTIYEKLGKNASDKYVNTDLRAIKDPVTFMRGVAFHTKLGLFNPVQLIMQAQSWVHTVAVAGPLTAMRAAPTASMMWRAMANRNPAVVKQMAEIASRIGGVSVDEFMESYDNLLRTGFYHVEGEVSWKDDVFDPKVVTTKLGRFLDAGTTFFRTGERFVRLNAWNAAYIEWKRANPGKVIDNAARNNILTRADDLTVNMTRSSNAAWQSGIASIPTQFLAYQMRLLEQFMGAIGGNGRLTRKEAASAFMWYGAMYGLPIAAGAATGIPFYESVRQAALEKGVNVDNVFIKSLIDGIPAAVASLTGENYNVSERFGPGGFKIFKEIARGDKTITEVLLGASGSIIGDIISSMYPLTRLVTDVFTDQPSERFPFAVEDVIDVTRNISSLNNLTKMYFAFNTGKYITKHEIYMGDVNTWDSIFMGMTGLQPQEVSDAFLKMDSLKTAADGKKEAEKFAIAEWRRGLKEAAANNVEVADKYFKRARVYLIMGGFQPHEYGSIVSKALQGYDSVVDRIAVDFVQKATNPDDKKARLQRLIEEQKKGK